MRDSSWAEFFYREGTFADQIMNSAASYDVRDRRFRDERSARSLADLNDARTWVAWREELRTRKDGTKARAKIPYDPNASRRASIPTEPATWGTRGQAERRWHELNDGGPGGVGVVLGEIDAGTFLMGIDLDRCIERDNNITAWACEALDRFNTYAEVSPSGKGIKLFFLIARDDVAAVKRLLGVKQDGTPLTRKSFAAGEHREIAIDTDRFYAVTGRRIEGPKSLRTVTVADVRWIVEEAGPRFLKMHSVPDKEPTTRPRDESGSGHGFRFMQERKAAGDNFEQAKRAILADRGPAGDWARTRADERQLERAWDNSKVAVRNTEKNRPLVRRSGDQFERHDIEWLWRPFVPLGMFTLVQGDKEVGKSSVLIDMAARISKGRPWPRFGDDPEERAPLGSVIILCKENDISRIIRPRLEAAGADLSRIHTLGYDVPDNPDEFDLLERLDTNVKELERHVIEIRDVRMIYIDSFTDYLGKIDMNRDDSVRALLNPLGRLASRHDLAIAGVLHFNKKEELSARYRHLGSVAFRNVSQSTLLIANNSGMPGERVMAQEAANLTPIKRAVSFSMRSVGAYHRVVWGRSWEDADVDEIMANKRQSKQQRAETLLREWLANGAVAVEELHQRAKAEGIGWRTIESAKSAIGAASIPPRQLGGKWSWELPTA
jgi:hypothetical protein